MNEKKDFKELIKVNPMLLGIREAAERLGISESCCRQMAYAGELPVMRVRRRLMVPVKQLEEWIDREFEAQRGDGGRWQ
jgi:excisionase family DNA binding protein